MKTSESKIEEIIATLYLIAAFVALGAGAPKWVFVCLLIKWGLDVMCCFYFAFHEIAAEKDKTAIKE